MRVQEYPALSGLAVKLGDNLTQAVGLGFVISPLWGLINGSFGAESSP